MSHGPEVAALDGVAAPPASVTAASVAAAAKGSSALLAYLTRCLTVIVESALSLHNCITADGQLPPLARARGHAAASPIVNDHNPSFVRHKMDGEADFC
jgi:hypothetical protein